jgi:hypothetical protein
LVAQRPHPLSGSTLPGSGRLARAKALLLMHDGGKVGVGGSVVKKNLQLRSVAIPRRMREMT